MTPIVQLTDLPDPAAKAAAGKALYAYNVAETGVEDRQPVSCVATDPDTGEVIGGLWGRTEIGLLFLDMFFLPESVRGSGIGSRLLEGVESEARRRGCRRGGDQQFSGTRILPAPRLPGIRPRRLFRGRPFPRLPVQGVRVIRRLRILAQSGELAPLDQFAAISRGRNAADVHL